jgi:hypothetical protein
VNSPPAQKPPPPGALDMAASLGSALTKFAASGFRVASREEYNARMKTCASCDQFDKLRCYLCGCFIDAKAWLPQEKCPLGKWAELG